MHWWVRGQYLRLLNRPTVYSSRRFPWILNVWWVNCVFVIILLCPWMYFMVVLMVLASCVTVCIPEIIWKSVLLSLFYIKKAIHVQFLQINKITVEWEWRMPFTLKFTSRYISLHLQAPIQRYIEGGGWLNGIQWVRYFILIIIMRITWI